MYKTKQHTSYNTYTGLWFLFWKSCRFRDTYEKRSRARPSNTIWRKEYWTRMWDKWAKSM